MNHASKEAVKNLFIDKGFNEEISDMAADIHMKYGTSICGLLKLLQMTAEAGQNNNHVNVAYVCDREECKECYDLCHHTTDVTHAVNFKHLGGNRYIERHENIIEDWDEEE